MPPKRSYVSSKSDPMFEKNKLGFEKELIYNKLGSVNPAEYATKELILEISSVSRERSF